MSRTYSLTKTKQTLEGGGWTVGIVERWVPQSGDFRGGKRSDLFGLFDLVAMNGQRILGVQACGDDYQAHVRKLLDASDLGLEWLRSGGSIQLWAWGRRKFKLVDGSWSKAYRWKPRVRDFLEEDFLADMEVGSMLSEVRTYVDGVDAPW